MIWHKAKASSFADPEDVRVYKACISQGHSEAYCLRKGDNGIGCYGDDTTTDEPCCALNKSYLISQWGSVKAAKHKWVEVEIKEQRIICVLKDIGAPKGRIDLNPGAVAAFGLTPPILCPATWRWL